MRQAEALMDRIEEPEAEKPDANTRILYILNRRAEIEILIYGIDEQRRALETERNELDAEFGELTGLSIAAPQPVSTEPKTRTCSNCHEKGHNKKGCPQLKET